MAGEESEGGVSPEPQEHDEKPRPRAVILAELAELIRLHVRPEWRDEELAKLPRAGQLELFR